MFLCMIGYETADGHVEIRWHKIAVRYLKSYFVLDLIATIPLDKILELLINDSQVNGLNKAGKLSESFFKGYVCSS